MLNTLRNLGMPQPQQQQPTLASFGQRYQPPATFDQRFGPFDARPDPEMMRRLFEEEAARQRQQEMLRNNPGAIIPGQDMIDYYGFQGQRHPSGYYQTKGI